MSSFRVLLVIAALSLAFTVSCGDDDDDGGDDFEPEPTPTSVIAPTPTPVVAAAACAPTDCGTADRVGSQAGCFCDEICFGLGDCCENVCDVCGPFPNC